LTYIPFIKESFEMKMQPYKNIDEYIAGFDDEKQEVLQKIRQTVLKAAPEATEKISYGIPTVVFHGNLVHFAAYDSHYAFYPGADPIQKFSEELTSLDTSKGTIRFRLGQPIPYSLIAKITSYRISQQKTQKVS